MTFIRTFLHKNGFTFVNCNLIIVVRCIDLQTGHLSGLYTTLCIVFRINIVYFLFVLLLESKYFYTFCEVNVHGYFL